jgi:F1F0 ATPase subunit 2
MPNELYILGGSLLAGVALGAAFFVALWWTTRRAVRSRHAALLMIASFAVRMGAVIVAFALLAQLGWQPVAAAMLGFIAARVAAVSIARRPGHAAKPSEAAEVD